MSIIYFLVALIATTAGALAGLGGGVIIKPALDFLGHYDLTTISVLSTCTVFSMAVISTYKQLRSGFKIEKSLYFLAAGSIFGGVLGEILFGYLVNGIPAHLASGIQSIILTLLLIGVLFRHFLPNYDVKNPMIVFLVGLALGTTAAFLGIGGGPFNVMVIVMVLNMDLRKSAVASVFIILLSQFAKLISIAVTTGFMGYDLSMLLYMIPAAIIGGLLGAWLNHFLTHNHINRIFNILVTSLVFLNMYNAYNFLLK